MGLFSKIQTGIGAVVRNCNGEVMATLSEKIPMPASMVLLEMLAARRAIQFVLELGIHNFVFKGDSEIVVTALNKSSASPPPIGHLVKDIQSIASLFVSHSFSHIRKQGNAIAHALAKRAKRARFYFPWMEHIPLYIFFHCCF